MLHALRVFHLDLVDRASEAAADGESGPAGGNARVDPQTLQLRMDTQNGLGDCGKAPGGRACEPAVLGLAEDGRVLSRHHLAVNIGLRTVDFTDIFQIGRTELSVGLKGPVPVAEPGLRPGNPGIVVGENARVFLIARRIAADFSQLQPVAGIWRLVKHDSKLGIQPLFHTLQGPGRLPGFYSDARHDAHALRLNVNLAFLAFPAAYRSAEGVIGPEKPSAVPAGGEDGFFGVTDFSNAYPYTVQAASDSSGVVKGVSFQCCPAAMIYRRSIAKDVLGTDDPAQVQAAVSDWDKFNAVAEQAAAKGYLMTASEAATYRVFSNNVSAPWVDGNNNLQIDENIQTWMKQAKDFSDKGYTQDCDIWSDECTAQMFASGKAMCYFGPAWYFNFSMGNAQDAEKGCSGDWAICQGPQAHFWGGTWLLAAAGSDNPTMLADVMNTFINDEEVCSLLVEKEAQFSNNKAVNAKFAEDPNFGNDFLGGQNDTAMFVEMAGNIKFENQTIYDQLLNDGLQSNWREYCKGTVSEEEAMSNFYKYVNEKYPSIVTP